MYRQRMICFSEAKCNSITDRNIHPERSSAVWMYFAWQFGITDSYHLTGHETRFKL